ncbi:TPA: hypothetical protein JBD46_16450, partial [Legionella pneumophila subsp. pneumophila]|nr:hypothetical protein [Legionella pneumophila subsp. pneumophila]
MAIVYNLIRGGVHCMMDINTILLFIIVLVFLRLFDLSNFESTCHQAIDHWLTRKYGIRGFEKRAYKRGFLDLFHEELTLRSHRPITQRECHY